MRSLSFSGTHSSDPMPRPGSIGYIHPAQPVVEGPTSRVMTGRLRSARAAGVVGIGTETRADSDRGRGYRPLCRSRHRLTLGGMARSVCADSRVGRALSGFRGNDPDTLGRAIQLVGCARVQILRQYDRLESRSPGPVNCPDLRGDRNPIRQSIQLPGDMIGNLVGRLDQFEFRPVRHRDRLLPALRCRPLLGRFIASRVLIEDAIDRIDRLEEVIGSTSR